MKISFKLILVFVLISLVVITVSSFILIQIGSDALEKRVEAQLNSISVLKQSQLNNFLEEEIEDIENIVSKKHFINTFITMQEAHKSNASNEVEEHNKVVRLLNEEYNSSDDFVELFILTTDGKIHISTNKDNEGKIKSGEDYFIKGMQDTFVQSFYYDITLQEPAMTVASPIIDGSTVTGVLVGRVNLDEVSKIMTVRTGLGETGETYLVNSFHFMVSESRFEEDQALRKTVYTDTVKSCLNGKEGHSHDINYRGTESFIYYRWLAELDVCLLTTIDEQEAFLPITKLKQIIIITGLSLIAFSVILAIILSRVFTNPINKLVQGTEKVGKGILGTKIKINSKDEFSKLASSFNKMTIDLKKSRDKLQSYSKNLEKIVKKRTKKLDRAIENLRKSDKIKTDFFNTASHELRTPLTPIRSRLELMRDGNLGRLTKEQESSVDILLKSVNRLNNLINDTLILSKITAKKSKMNFTKSKISDVVEFSLDTIGLFAAEKNIKLEKSIQKIPSFYFDKEKISRVLDNLIKNAVKFTNAGGKIIVKASIRHKNVLISVKDNGIGIKSEDLNRVFLPFSQIYSIRSRKQEGTGLGLSICQNIIKLHKGKIWVESKEGVGSTFYFTLPFRKEAGKI